jgi:hypothetical protein
MRELRGWLVAESRLSSFFHTALWRSFHLEARRFNPRECWPEAGGRTFYGCGSLEFQGGCGGVASDEPNIGSA